MNKKAAPKNEAVAADFSDLPDRFDHLPGGMWSKPPHSAIALPLFVPDQPRAYGVFIASISPHRELDEVYRTFFELAAGQVTTAIRNAKAYQEEKKRAEAPAEIDRAKTLFFSNAEPLYVDREMWEKIVLNLLSNAFKFTLEGKIEVRLRRENGGAVLSIRDTGTGIPEEEIPHVFERFHRIKGARARSFEGTGIGLALVHELVGLHGGKEVPDYLQNLYPDALYKTKPKSVKLIATEKRKGR